MPSVTRNPGVGAAGFSSLGGSAFFASAGGDWGASMAAGGKDDGGGGGACSAGGGELAQPNVAARIPTLSRDRYCGMSSAITPDGCSTEDGALAKGQCRSKRIITGPRGRNV